MITLKIAYDQLRKEITESALRLHDKRGTLNVDTMELGHMMCPVLRLEAAMGRGGHSREAG